MDTDTQFVQAFESCTLPPSKFRHAQHVKLAWLYLREEPAPLALMRFVAGLKRFAVANGVPDLYHETITWAYVCLIHERMERTGKDIGWDEFARLNADLFQRDFLSHYYSPKTLSSALARKVFLFPDRGGQNIGDQTVVQ